MEDLIESKQQPPETITSKIETFSERNYCPAFVKETPTIEIPATA
jgi:hypothetical protein